MNPGRGVTILVAVVLLLTMSCSLVALLTAREMERLMGTMVLKDLPSVEAAAELQNALLQQRGLVAAYMLDEGRLAWVNDLDRSKPMLAHWLAEAKRTARTDEERNILAQLTEVYVSYDKERERAIALFEAGRTSEARNDLLGDVSRLSDQANGLCRQLVSANERYMASSLVEGHQRVFLMALALGSGVGIAILLTSGLLLILFRRFLLPMRRLAKDAKAFSDAPSMPARPIFDDEVHELEFYSRALMSDMTRTRTSLEESQLRLVTAEKLAAVGKFAACAAHEIRNPLTSMKMWLYELKRSAGDQPEIATHCRVLDEEIRRLEELATSFLQFSRPPNLQLAPESIDSVVDCTLQLAHHRLDEKGLRVVRVNGSVLPLVMADAHQLKQVLLNLLANAADAAPEGGEVRIIESLEPGAGDRPDVVVRVEDDGPGVPEEVRRRLFEPFVTTKPNGTGLGLCIASSIVAHHGGRLSFESSDRPGAAFAMRIPACGD
jgi:signal transduction histidine kinase